MDEDEINDNGSTFASIKKHDRWSVLILSLNFATQVACQAANYLSNITEIAAQHKNHLLEQDSFSEITAYWSKDG